MAGWIKFDKEMGDDPRLLQAAAQLGKVYTIARASGSDLSAVDRLAFACNAVTGALVTLWQYADVHIRDDDTLPMTRETLDAMVGIDGFFAIMPRDWIDELDGGIIVLPGYCKKNSLIAKKNATVKSNARVTAFRARKKGNGNGRGHALPRRYDTVSKVVDQDQDQDQEKNKTGGGAKRATRIPDDFTLTPERRQYAMSKGVDPDPTFEAFVAYWRSKAKDNTKLEWDDTWHSWVLKEAKEAKQKNTPRKSRFDEATEHLAHGD